MATESLTLEEIIEFFDICFEVEFTFIRSEQAAELLVAETRATQDFILNLTRRVAATNQELAFQFALNAMRAMQAMDLHMVEAWAMTATDNYDRKGLSPAMNVIRNLDGFVQTAHIKSCGAVLEDEMPVLLAFTRGLSGRKIKIAEADDNQAYTDTETIYLPAISALLEDEKDNFLVYKASIAFLWAQIQFGTFRFSFDSLLDCNDPDARLDKFFALERIRLEAKIKHELPGLYRDMQALKQKEMQQSGLNPETDDELREITNRLASKHASINDTLACLAHLTDAHVFPPCCYHGSLRLEEVHRVMQKRIEKEKAYFHVALSELAKEHRKNGTESADAGDDEAGARFGIKDEDNIRSQQHSGVIELELDGELIHAPDHVRELMTSIVLDFGEIPPEYLYAAGPGEYDLKKYEEDNLKPHNVWQGTYHEEGAELYNEWNFKRQSYHKNWCVLRELDVEPVHDDFVENTLLKHRVLLKSLRHSFEILRGEDKLLKKQVHGDNIDIDALVEAYADVTSGMEMTDRLYTRLHKMERNVAVIFMVDMSGSTRGWINEAERESLILLAEVMQLLDDRFAIYGFSGMTRKRCELYRVKSFDEDYDEEIKARIANIQPKDYTRMGVFIRHMTRLLNNIDASTKLLVTLSDGKPDDYDTYRGEYGVEDTRQALYEAHCDGIHSYCITIDREAREYLPHMYGAANYSVIDDIRQLPLKVSEIYRRLTA